MSTERREHFRSTNQTQRHPGERRAHNNDGNEQELRFPVAMSFVEEHKKEGVDVRLVDSTPYDAYQNPVDALIYSAPTVDTLGDESTSIRPYSWRGDGKDHAIASGLSTAPQNSLEEQQSITPAQGGNTLNRSNRTSTPVRGSLSSTQAQMSQTPDQTPTKQRSAITRSSPIIHRSTVPPSPFRQKSTTPSSNMPSNSYTYFHPPRSHNVRAQRGAAASVSSSTNASGKRRIPSQPSKPKKGDRQFQREEDSMSVSVRKVSLKERVAFDMHHLISLEDWEEIARTCQERSSGSVTGGSTYSLPLRRTKLSPSLQHLQLLHKMQSINQIRQLAFSPSCGLASDQLFVPPAGDEDFYDFVQFNHGQKSLSSSRSHKRDGRYRSIDPVKATLAALPASPPLLSNKKHRLPMRSDVGFPNASVEEIQQKQAEIALETEWEEASPRLVVLVTSDDLGTAVQEEPIKGHPLMPLTHPWNEGGLDGMPWAGRELQIQKSRNKRHFSGNNSARRSKLQPSSLSCNSGDSESSVAARSSKNKNFQKEPFFESLTRYSMLAPPLDATHSKTYGWRARPFHDRQPEMSYALACPVKIDFDVGNIEPLLCSLALYSLPISAATTVASSSAATTSTTANAGRKISEDFWFPAGDWKGRVDLASLSKSGDKVSAELVDSWHERTHKAIFSYSLNALNRDPSQGFEDLHVVLQVYKVTHVEASTAYLATRGGGESSGLNHHQHQSLRLRLQKKFRKRGVENPEIVDSDVAAHRTIYRASAAFDQFGTQFMTPLCFGVVKLCPCRNGKMSSTAVVPEQMLWPKGAMQDMQLHCFPDCSVSQEDFCQRLVKIAATLPRDTTVASDTADDNVGARESSGTLFFMQGDEQTAEVGTPGLSISASSVSSESSSTSVVSGTAPTDSSPPSKLSSMRRLMSHRKHSRIDLKHQQKQPLPRGSSSIAGRAKVFTSSLPVDFLQAMLFTPTEIEAAKTSANCIKSEDPARRLARVLVDVSGDSAIMVDPRKDPTVSSVGASADTFTTPTSTIGDGQTRKRSSLIRLPSPKAPAGYIDAAEFREVLFLPPRIDKSFETKDVPPSYRSFLNLLYLFPKVLRLDNKQGNISSALKLNGNKHQRRGGDEKVLDRQNRFTIRIRIVQSSTGLDKNSGLVESVIKVLDQFHNPAPWAGPALLNEVYTRIPGDRNPSALNGTSGDQIQDDIKIGIPMKDEFKLRLPMVLDGSYFLQFSLFAVEIHDDLGDSDSLSGGGSSRSENSERCISLYPLAETTIPLSSSSTRDSLTGIKSTTIIPNGYHRLKLGDFQLQLETRLVSSIHVSDPAVATALREFPFVARGELVDEWASELSGENLQELALVARHPSRGDKKTASLPDKVPYSALFSKASANALIGHFQELLFMHLSNLVVGEEGDLDAEPSRIFLSENVRSLLEICRRVKASFLSDGDSLHGDGRRRLDAFFKGWIDAFDEGLLNAGASVKHEYSEEDAASEALPAEEPRNSKYPHHKSDFVEDDQFYGEDFDGGAIRRRNKDSLRSGIDVRISRTFSAMESTTGIPFSRVAYGASKTDRMKLEAELHHENGGLSYLVDDDDETVYTAASMYSGNDANISEVREAFNEKIKWGTIAQKQDPDYAKVEGSNVIESPVDAEQTLPLPDLRDWQSYSRTFGEFGLAKRVRHAAHVMLSPCVAPNVSTLFVAKNSPPYSKPSNVQQSPAGKTSFNPGAEIPSYQNDRKLVSLIMCFERPRRCCLPTLGSPCRC